MSKKDAGLNNKTPKWFEEWHYRHYVPTRNRSKRNEALIYIILAAILGAAAFGDGVAQAISRVLGG